MTLNNPFISLNDPRFKELGVYYNEYYDEVKDNILDIYNGNYEKYGNSNTHFKLFTVLAEYNILVNHNFQEGKRLLKIGVELNDYEAAETLSTITEDLDEQIKLNERSIELGNPKKEMISKLSSLYTQRFAINKNGKDSIRAYDLMIKGVNLHDVLSCLLLSISYSNKRNFNDAKYCLEVASMLYKIDPGNYTGDFDDALLFYKNYLLKMEMGKL